MKFIELEYWNDEDILKLINLITKIFNIRLPTKFDKKLVTNSKGSPRYIKKYFRNVLAIEKFDENSLNNMLDETARELSY